jgi:murein DD-endopeptidase MepM/ murein hydrolase activator NlpD
LSHHRLRALAACLIALVPLVFAAAAEARFGDRTLRTGSRGHDVRVLQSWLTKVGFPTGIDGVFGRRTRWNLRRFEQRERRAVNGVLSRGDARLLRVRMREAVASDQRERPVSDPSAGEHVFPVRGRHDFGGSGARFGAGRSGHSHQGQDVFAACGTPLVAAQGGRVEYAGWHDAAGNYVVITGAQSGEDYVYMHMSDRSALSAGDPVQTGQQIGTVGETGNARGCHLHFELWSAPGWYKGGAPYDPLPKLRAWDAAS